MTEAATTDTAPATTDTAPDTSSPAIADTATPPVGDTPPATPPEGDTPPTQDFTLPDEWKDKPWADKVKSQDDAYKQIENLTALVGKKTIQPIDFETATPEQITEHYAGLAPDDVSKYDFGEGSDPEFSAAVGEVFKEFGINQHQAKGLSEKINEIAKGITDGKEAVDRDTDTYLGLLEESFGKDYKQVAKQVDASIQKHASEDDKKFFDGISDNATRAALDRTIHSILTKHGALESGSQGDSDPAASTPTDVEAVRADLRKQAREIDSRPHTMEERQSINKKIAETYKNDPRINK